MKDAISKILSGNGTCKDALKYLFGLGEFEMTVYKGLCKLGTCRVDELALYLRRGNSTVYRALQKLVIAGLIAKETCMLKRGGHFHRYTAVPLDEMREKLKICTDEWYESVKLAIEKGHDDIFRVQSELKK
jgi:predicted transcriptional regulator